MNSQTPASDFKDNDHGTHHLGNRFLPRLFARRPSFVQLFYNLMVFCFFGFIAILPLVSTIISDSHTRLRAQALVITYVFSKTHTDAEIRTHWKSVVTPPKNLSDKLFSQLFRFCIAIPRT